MADPLPAIHLVRHGDTAWSRARRHTGRSDPPLTAEGEAAARALAPVLAALAPATVVTSPLARARRTMELAGFAAIAAVDPDLVEWDYGAYEGLTSAEIEYARPGWRLFRDGCPDGESVAAIGARADRVVARLRVLPRPAIIFASGHILRVVAARWLGLPPGDGRLLAFDTAARGVLGEEHGEPALVGWNLR